MSSGFDVSCVGSVGGLVCYLPCRALPIGLRCVLCILTCIQDCVITKSKSCANIMAHLCLFDFSHLSLRIDIQRLASLSLRHFYACVLGMRRTFCYLTSKKVCDFSWYFQSHMRQVGRLIWSPCKLVGAWNNILELYLYVQLPVIEFLASSVIFYYHCSRKTAVTAIFHIYLFLPVQLTYLKCFIFKSYS